MEIKNPQYLGKVLLQKGFRVWFKYLFYIIEGNKFVEESLHTDLFTQIESIYKQDDIRVNINIPPRSGKTTMAKYFLAYCWAQNSKSNFIYTSFSQSLLTDIARSLIDILEHPIYKAMYNLSVYSENSPDKAIDEFWRKYIQQDNQKTAQYSTRKIVSPTGGIILFASVGSAITGFGAGSRVSDEFSGALIIDDANKPADIHSQVMKNKVADYYEGTLLSRLNNPNVPILNIQQRLDIQDLAGHLKEKYKFKTLSRPLVVDGVCQLPSQYSEQRLKEIKVNDFVFQSQYQQEPIPADGNIIKKDWFKYFTNVRKYKRIVISWDTAVKDKQINDPSVATVWGEHEQGYDLIEVYRNRLNYPSLKKEVIKLAEKYKTGDYYSAHRLMTILIEDKASGSSLIQDMKTFTNYNIVAILPESDKATRLSTCSPQIANGKVYLNQNAKWLDSYIEELTVFPNATHDDQADSTSQFLNWITNSSNGFSDAFFD